MEERNKPAVTLCDRGFVTDAGSAASSRGMPGIRNVGVVDSPWVAEELRPSVTAAMDDIITALTKPLTEEEKSPKKEVEKTSGIIFKGNLEEVNQFFYRRGWTDGLPIIPPTEEAVAEMLTGTDLPADQVVDRIIPRLGKATVEKIAINAVMAGALPTYMPLLIAGVQAVMDARAEYGTWSVSTGSWSPCWMVNGPIRNDLHINSGSGMLSPGDIANAAIGRAMGLILKNIGGIRKGVEDMGVMGNPMKYTMVMAENEEQSPWEPLHVEQGLNREDSAVTLFFPNSCVQMTSGGDDDSILSTAIYNIGPGRRDGLTCILLHPRNAKILADKGWTKQEIVKFISQHAYVPFSHHPHYRGGPGTGMGQRFQQPLNPQDPILLIPYPERIKLFVAGGPGPFMGIIRGSHFESEGWESGFVTKKVELPANWDKLVAKYKNLVPTYVRY